MAKYASCLVVPVESNARLPVSPIANAFGDQDVNSGLDVISFRDLSTSGNGIGARRSRTTPRKSVVVVLPENHILSAELLHGLMPDDADGEKLDIIVACAGETHNVAALQSTVRDVQVLLAPAGTSREDLRELGMTWAAGDIVTLLSGTPV